MNQGGKGSSENAKELQRVKSLAKVIQTLFRDIYNNIKIPKGRKIILKGFHRPERWSPFKRYDSCHIDIISYQD